MSDSEELDVVEVVTEGAADDGTVVVDDLVAVVDEDGNIVATDETIAVEAPDGSILIDEIVSVADEDGELVPVAEDVIVATPDDEG